MGTLRPQSPAEWEFINLSQGEINPADGEKARTLSIGDESASSSDDDSGISLQDSMASLPPRVVGPFLDDTFGEFDDFVDIDDVNLILSNPPTTEDWNHFRPIITDVYRRHTIKEMIAIMTNQYSFVASKRMYMQRVAAWGIQKNTKAWQKEAAAQLLSAEADTADAVVLDDGHEVTRRKIRRHQKTVAKRRALTARPRSPGTRTSGANNRPGTANSIHNSVALIRSSPSPNPSEPRTIDSVEPLLFDLENYFRSYFENGPGQIHARRFRSSLYRQSPCYTGEAVARTGRFSELNPARLLDQYTASLKMMRRGHWKVGWKLFDELFDIAQPMFKEQHPRLIGSLLVMSRTEAADFAGLYPQLWKHLSDLSTIIHGFNHPLSKLCRFLGGSKTKSEGLELLLHQNVKSYDRHLVNGHDKVIRARLNHIDYLLQDVQKAVELQYHLNEMVKQCEPLYGQDDILVRTALYRLGWLQEDYGSLKIAEDIYRDIIKRSSRSATEGVTDRICARVPVRLASMLTKQGRIEDAENLLHKALDDCEQQFGSEDYETMVVLGVLVENLTTQDKHDDASLLRQRFHRVLEAS